MSLWGPTIYPWFLWFSDSIAAAAAIAWTWLSWDIWCGSGGSDVAPGIVGPVVISWWCGLTMGPEFGNPTPLTEFPKCDMSLKHQVLNYFVVSKVTGETFHTLIIKLLTWILLLDKVCRWCFLETWKLPIYIQRIQLDIYWELTGR